MPRQRLLSTLTITVILALLLGAGLAAINQLHDGLLSHNVYDQHTRQAMAWRDGNVSLAEDAPWLELVPLEGRWFISFPAVPSIFALLQSLYFDANTPNNLFQLLLALFGLLGFWRFFVAESAPPLRALLLAVGLCLGSNYLWLSLSGAVWYIGQITGCVLAIWGLHIGLHWHQQGQRPWAWALGAFLLALAVGCRPFYALLFPLLWLWQGEQRGERLRYIVAAAAPVALLLASYNRYRFGSPIEFGHNLLPVYAGEALQFSLAHLSHNLQATFLRLPEWRDGWPHFNMGGNAIWLVAPVLLLGLLLPFGRLSWQQGLLWLLSLLAIWFPLLLHHSNGQAQWGYRYMVDLLPLFALAFGVTLARWRYWWASLPVLLLSVVINIGGAYIWYAQPQTMFGQPWQWPDSEAGQPPSKGR